MAVLLPGEYEGSVCEIRTVDNTFICTGRISSIESDKIKITVKSRQFKSIPFGFRIKINVISSKMGLRVIEGKVFTYTLGTVTITDIKSIVEGERRKYFRVDMNMTSNAFFENSFTGKITGTQIIIKNMSLNGIKFASRSHFDMGAVVNFNLQISHRKNMELTCTVIRRGNDGVNGYMSYIGRILNSSEHEDDVCSFLLQKQGEMINNTKR